MKEKTEHICTVTIGGGPHSARAVDSDESSTRPVSAACRGGTGRDTRVEVDGKVAGDEHKFSAIQY